MRFEMPPPERPGKKPKESSEERDERRRKERLDKERREREGFQFRLDRTWENFETAQTQEERLDALEGICHLLLERARSALAVEIMLKMLGKIRLKRQVADMNAHADDDTYQKMKRLGLFILIHRELDRPYGDRESGLDIPAGTEIVELHLPPPPPEKKRTPLQLVAEARKSLRQVARYLALHEDRMQPEFITGITYEAMADAAEKLGFETREIDLPDELRDPVVRVYQELVAMATDEGQPKPRPMGKIKLVFMETAKLKRKWGDD